MEITDILDQETLDAIYADAAASGISASDVKAVLGTLTDDTRAPSRSANSQGELMSLLDDDKDAVVNDIADATGVERGKTGTILMLAAPFLLKYLFSSGAFSLDFFGVCAPFLLVDDFLVIRIKLASNLV